MIIINKPNAAIKDIIPPPEPSPVAEKITPTLMITAMIIN